MAWHGMADCIEGTKVAVKSDSKFSSTHSPFLPMAILRSGRPRAIANGQLLALIIIFITSISMSSATPPIKVTVVGKFVAKVLC
jgi:hypothetical protein